LKNLLGWAGMTHGLNWKLVAHFGNYQISSWGSVDVNPSSSFISEHEACTVGRAFLVEPDFPTLTTDAVAIVRKVEPFSRCCATKHAAKMRFQLRISTQSTERLRGQFSFIPLNTSNRRRLMMIVLIDKRVL
jgi:hypothetical protein